jgi:hypothetical protein
VISANADSDSADGREVVAGIVAGRAWPRTFELCWVTAVTHEGLETGESDLRASFPRLNFLPSSRSSSQEGPEEAILNRFSTDEIVTVIRVVVCMVAAVVVTVAKRR